MAATAQTFTAEERQAYIGGSEIAAIMGVDRFRTPLDVYNDKVGLTVPFAGNAHTERGKRLESIAAEQYTLETGIKLRRQAKMLVHPQYPFIVGHIDRKVEGSDIIVEIKCPSIASFRVLQRNGLPESMVMQMQMYLGLTGCDIGTWLIFCADAWDLAAFDINFEPDLYKAGVNTAVQFWLGHVVPQIPPETDKKRDDVPTVEINRVGGTVTVRDDENFATKAAAVREAIELKRDAESLFEIAKTDFIENAIEDLPGVYEGGGLRVYYTESSGRTTFDKKGLAAKHPEIDLTEFEKTGKPFKTFRTYITNKGEK